LLPRRAQLSPPCRLLDLLAPVGNLPERHGLLLLRHAGFSENRKNVMAITASGREPI
jgi:hypothetical protein